MSDLKPCPVCGETAHVASYIDRDYSGEEYFYVECNACPIRTEEDTNRQRIIDAWNNLPNVKAELDWLAQQLANACQCRRAEECPITGHSQCPHDSNMCACLDVEYVEWLAVASREVECHAN